MIDAQMINIITIVAIGVAILGAIAATACFMFRQMNMVKSRLTNRIQESETRQTTERHESERRLTEMITAVEQCFNRQIDESEKRLVELYREVNRDTKTLIGKVQFIRAKMGVPPLNSESDFDATVEAAV